MTRTMEPGKETVGTLLRHKGGMYAVIVYEVPDGYRVEYVRNVTDPEAGRLTAKFSEARDWEVVRVGS